MAVSSLTAISRAEAKRLGLPRYFTGEPCRNGHIAERFTVNGTCRECNRVAVAAALDPVENCAKAKAWYAANRTRAVDAARDYKQRIGRSVLKQRHDSWMERNIERAMGR